jgi:hypothetical protein
MSNNNSGQQVIGGLILLILAIGLLRGCVDERFQDRYDYCMAGSYKTIAIFKAIFVCLWV